MLSLRDYSDTRDFRVTEVTEIVFIKFNAFMAKAIKEPIRIRQRKLKDGNISLSFSTTITMIGTTMNF